MGSGVGGALSSGGAVVLPAADGIRGCGYPKQRAEVTAAVLGETGATLLIADSHIIKNMPSAGASSATTSALALRKFVVRIPDIICVSPAAEQHWQSGGITSCYVRYEATKVRGYTHSRLLLW